ncbi:DeoR/GlpR family DNA-binding transcription regulator [Robertmurraya sp. DFI.2.37]|uniref:DeoR/GlpR family DNA-binding transcription regulator n=1 Tax=Robertmurraya sp. DFI.2.37 TaxID=3031819 RepID=UPI0023DB27D0|nr:DeoR/GlpR family DNA-binding transcription regulator [Robertmurraya sp. DFI.2.37]MDF1510273.1 DeoR/GlpR family DNA-binding transcription regulator [Robertmurraya sp. DFI.2.37]
MEWFPDERIEYILEQLKKNHKVKVNELANHFNVTMETVRRDLDALAENNLVKRVYGGAVRVTYFQGEPPLNNRKSVMEKEKKAIGMTAATLIKDGSLIAIDTGTTVIELANAIKNKRDLTIVTNSLTVSSILSEKMRKGDFQGEMIILGGRISPEQESITGSMAEAQLSQFNVDQAFISVGGMSLKNGLSDYDLNETVISQRMISSAKEVIVLADHSKFGVDAFYKMASFDQVDAVVCSEPLPSSWEAHPSLENINWIVSEEI